MQKTTLWKRGVLAASVLAAFACVGTMQTAAAATPAEKSAKAQTMYSLDFSKQPYTSQTAQVNGQTIAYRAYEGIVYVRHPVEVKYQTMNIYVPEAYFHGGTINGWTAKTAPIFLPNKVGGYMPGEAGKPGARGFGPMPQAGGKPPADGVPMAGAKPPAGEGMPGAGNVGQPPQADGAAPAADTMQVALSKGYVVASPGARGRTSVTGKAPAAIVDLKAAVRYLHANQGVMPGDTNKIISNGTSAGGALSVLLGASGNSKDYAPYLKALGAAEASDAIFAVSAYCPISILDHADAAYEWQFNGVNDYKKMDISMLDYKVQRKLVPGTLTAQQQALSKALKPQFTTYVNSLGLKDSKGQPLTLDAQGNGSFKRYVEQFIMRSAQQQLDAGKDLSDRKWLTIRQGKTVTGMDFAGYAQAAGRQKTPPAFDAVDLSAGENQLFGTATVDKQHFTDFSQAQSTVPATRADAKTVAMMNPMGYIGRAATAPHWRIRVGTADRDTSLAIASLLNAKLQQTGRSVDFALPWDVPHSGDYDIDALFAWMQQVTR